MLTKRQGQSCSSSRQSVSSVQPQCSWLSVLRVRVFVFESRDVQQGVVRFPLFDPRAIGFSSRPADRLLSPIRASPIHSQCLAVDHLYKLSRLLPCLATFELVPPLV